MPIVATTADIPEAERISYWRDLVCDTFVELDCRPFVEHNFHGEIASVRASELCLSRIRSCAGQVKRTPGRIRGAREELLLVSLQISGTSVVSQDDREAFLEPGDFACYDSTRPYVLTFARDFEQLVVHMPLRRPSRQLGRTERLTAQRLSGRTGVGALTTNFLLELYSKLDGLEPQTACRLGESGIELLATALGDFIGGQSGRQSWSQNALFYRAVAFIESNIRNPSLNVEIVAAALGISVRYVQQLFKCEQTTLNKWIWDRRLEKCRQDLVDPLLANSSITQIALAGGFSDLGHFSRRFREAFGITPRECRSQATALHNSPLFRDRHPYAS